MLRGPRGPASPNRDHAAGDSYRVGGGVARARNAHPQGLATSRGTALANIPHTSLPELSALPTPSARCAIAANTCRRPCRSAWARWPRFSAWIEDKVAAVCHDAAQGEVCEPANINSPEQIVISGNTAAVERAAKLADERGAKRAKLLPVSAPFHCSLMKPAQDRLASRSRRAQIAEARLSRGLQRGCRTGDRRSARPRHAAAPGHRISEVGCSACAC